MGGFMKRGLAAAAWVALSLAGGVAGAHEEQEDDERLPRGIPERPLTLPPRILSVETEIAAERLAPLTNGTLTLGARYGVTNTVELRSVLVPLLLGPFGGEEHKRLSYFNPSFGVTYHFLHGGFEMSTSVGVTIVHQRYEERALVPAFAVDSGAIVEPGVAFRAHLSRAVKLEGGVSAPLEGGSVLPELRREHTWGVGLRAPLSLTIDIVTGFHVGVRSGVGMVNFTKPEAGGLRERVYIPAGAFAGYAVGGTEGPILDINPFFTWGQLVTPGAERHGLTNAQITHTNDFNAGLGLTGFLYL